MSRRRVPDTQGALFGATPEPKVVRAEPPPPKDYTDWPAEPLPGGVAEKMAADEAKRPKLRLVHSVKEWDVTVEATDDPDAFYVTRYRDSGTSSSAMLFTREQLERLIARASAALKVT